MKRNLLWILTLMMASMCYAEDITIRYNGAKAEVQQNTKDSVSVIVDGANVNIESLYKEHKLTLRLTGKSDNGQLTLKTAGKAKVELDGLTLTSQEGAPLDLKNKKKVEVVATKGTNNTLTITACNDTANHKAATIWAKDKLLLSGKGTLNIIATGDGCRGIKTKKDITIEELTLNVTTSGDNLGEKPFGFGGGMPDFGGFFMPFGGNNNQQDTTPAIIIRGGTVYAWSKVGSPEEGLDCDFAPLVVEGGTIFSVGGGMGEMPSVPSNEDAKQPTALLIGLNVVKNEPIYIYDGNGKQINTVTIPFSLRRSASLVSSPAFKLSSTYTVKTKGYERTFTLNEPFTTVR